MVGAPALAATRSVVVPNTTLDRAIPLLSSQLGVEIFSLEPGLGQVRVSPISGPMSAREALRRLLRDTNYRAVAVDGGYRIVRFETRPRVKSQHIDRVPGPDIVVTAGKQNQSLALYPGSVTLVSEFSGDGQSRPPRDLNDIARSTPVLQSTSFGEGRDKLFIRGIADSSFNGATQSPSSIYFGDAQLGFASPNPSVKLYDINSVEILEGPQGTLYGSGAIGGVVRINPNRVDMSDLSASASAGVTLGLHTLPGFDGAAVVNIPIADNTLGVRGVAYRTRDGGVLDLRDRGLLPNQVDTAGGRAALRFDAGGWDVEVSGLFQDTNAENSQYAEAGPVQMRAAGLAQPFSNSLQVGRLVVEHDWDAGLHFSSSTSLVGRQSFDAFDATSPTGQPTVYSITRSALFFTQEMRLLKEWRNGGSWVIGANYLRARDAQVRSLGIPDQPVELDEVTNITYSFSGFAQTTLPISKRLQVTLGGRVTYARTDGEPATASSSAPIIRGQPTTRFDPTAAINWKFAPRFAVYGRVQTGYRTGGIAVARGVGRVADFQPDSIVMGEVGVRRIGGPGAGPSLSLAASFADWDGVQSDLISTRGLPYTTNLGSAQIATLEGTIDWQWTNGLAFSAAALATNSSLSGPLADQSNGRNRRLPDTPDFAASARGGYHWSCWSAKCRAEADYRYVGSSVLGPGNLLDVRQGDYAIVGASLGVRVGRLDWSLTADNLTNSRANLFSFGNPLTIAARAQRTPYRPMSIRLGVAVTL